MIRLSSDVADVLSRAEARGTSVVLPEGQLDRKLYEEVDRVLKALGGVWIRRERAHVYANPPAGGLRAALDRVLDSGVATSWRSELGFFETPPDLARRLVSAAGVEAGMRVLEPSAGRGAIVAQLPAGCDLTLVEIDERHSGALLSAAAEVHPTAVHARIGADCGDFTRGVVGSVVGEFRGPFDAVVMNPPFAAQVDIDHVLRAAHLLRPGGRLAAIMSAGVLFRRNVKSQALRDLVAGSNGCIEELPAESFRTSGTEVRTVLVTLVRP